MSKGGLGRGELIFLVGTILGAVVFGAWRLIAGHLPKDIGWGYLGFAGLCFLDSAKEYFDNIRDDTQTIKEQFERIERCLGEIQSKISDRD